MTWVLAPIVERDTGLTALARSAENVSSALSVLDADLFSETRLRRRTKMREACGNVPPGPRVYFLYRQGQMIYIGKSRNIAERLARHPIAFDRFATVRCEDALLDSLEAMYIAKYRPEHNQKMERHTLAPRMKLGSRRCD